MADKRLLTLPLLQNEVNFSFSRSSGPGGQNVNKLNTKVTLTFDVLRSKILSDEEKSIIVKKLGNKITREGFLLLTAQDKRTQSDNKASVIVKFETLLEKAFEKRKTRKATKPGKSAVQKRIDKKKQTSEKKKWRQKPI